MTITTIAPAVRGAYIAKHGVPVVLSLGEPLVQPDPTDEAAGSLSQPLSVQAASADDLPQALADAELALPGDVTVEVAGETYTFAARVHGDPQPVADPRSAEARSATARGAVVDGRVALVTGGAQGFGEEIVRGLVSSGAVVYIADLNLEGAERLAAELGDAAYAVKVNVADEDSVAELAEFVARTTGGLDLVVSNAGIARAGSVLTQELSAFELSTDINYVAFFLITKHLGGLLAKQHSTAPAWLTDIIQINSKSGLEGSNKNGAYAGSKFGGIGLVQSFAMEMVEYGVKVNAICPGNFLDGPLWSDPDRGLFKQYFESGKVPGAKTVDDVRAFYEAKVPLGRGTYGADVMRAVYYIVEQDYETGQAVPVTGGQVMLSS